MPKTRILVFLLLTFLPLFPLSCGQDQPADPKAEAFRRQTLQLLSGYAARLEKSVSIANAQEVRDALAAIFGEAAEQGAFPHYGLFVLDKSGYMVAGREPCPPDSKGRPWTPSSRFVDYKVVSTALRGRVNQDILYFSGGGQRGDKMYVICSPLGRPPAGAVCMAYYCTPFEKAVGISDQEFESLRFDQP